MAKQNNTEEYRMRASMIRGSLPLAWLATLSSTVLLYSMSTTDPDFGEIIAKLQSPFALLAAVLVLSFVTFSFGLPARKELFSATLVGVAGGAAVIILASVASVGLFFIAAFFFIVPLSRFLFRWLMTRQAGE